MDKRLVSKKELSNIISASTGLIDKYVEDGIIPMIQLEYWGKCFFDVDEVVNALKERSNEYER